MGQLDGIVTDEDATDDSSRRRRRRSEEKLASETRKNGAPDYIGVKSREEENISG